MAVSEEVIVALRAAGQAAFQSAMESSAESVSGVGKAAETTSKQTADVADSAKKAEPRWKTFGKTIGKWALATGAVYGVTKAVKSSTQATFDMAKAAMTLKRATGLDLNQAAAWAEITKVRGINTKQFQTSLVKLSKELETARTKGGKAADTLTALGISQQTIKSGNIQDAILSIADAFSKMQNPAEKAALAQKLFGRQGQTLLPLLTTGSAGIREQLAMYQRYFPNLNKAADASTELTKGQREMQMATDGLKASLGTALSPVLVQVSHAMVDVTRAMQPLMRDPVIIRAVLIPLVAAFAAYKVAVVASTLASAGLLSVWLAIPLAIAAVGLAFVIAYRKVGWFRDAVNAVFNFIRTHWPLLVSILGGPIGAATVLIIKNFGKIKSAITSVIGFFRRIPAAASSAFNSVKRAASSAAGWVADRWRDVIAFFRRLPGAILSAIGDLGPRITQALTPGGAAGAALGVVRKIRGRQHGGIVGPGEITLVGERGPELLQLPGGSRITPLPSMAPPAPVLVGAQTTAHFYLDRRLVATAVATDTADRKARR